MGFRSWVKRSVSSFQGATSSLGSANFLPSSCLQGGEVSVVSRNRVHSRKQCCRGTSNRSLDTGVLFPDVSCPQEVRFVEAEHRSTCSQQVRCQPSFQNGDSKGLDQCDSSRTIGYFNRPEGRLFPYSHFEIV